MFETAGDFNIDRLQKLLEFGGVMKDRSVHYMIGNRDKMLYLNKDIPMTDLTTDTLKEEITRGARAV
jgi:hypothetical protein